MRLSAPLTSPMHFASQRCRRSEPANASATAMSPPSTSFSSPSTSRKRDRRRPRPRAPSPGGRRERPGPLLAPVAAASEASGSPSSSSSSPPPPRTTPFRSPPPPPTGWERQVDDIDSRLLSKVVLRLFRSKMALSLGGRDSDLPQGSYDAIVDLTKRLNALPARETAERTRAILKSLFPSWLPGAFSVLFSKPMPYVSARINAEATAIACAWLMGPTEVNDGGDGVGGGGGVGGEGALSTTSTPSAPPSPSSSAGHRTGCKVVYCRYLASTGCVSACLNSCKLPTQRFFSEDMGLELRMSPCLEDFSCQFSFGVPPDAAEDEELLRGASCLSGCGILGGKGGGVGGGDGVCPGARQLREEVENAAASAT